MIHQIADKDTYQLTNLDNRTFKPLKGFFQENYQICLEANSNITRTLDVLRMHRMFYLATLRWRLK